MAYEENGFRMKFEDLSGLLRWDGKALALSIRHLILELRFSSRRPRLFPSRLVDMKDYLLKDLTELQDVGRLQRITMENWPIHGGVLRGYPNTIFSTISVKLRQIPTQHAPDRKVHVEVLQL